MKRRKSEINNNISSDPSLVVNGDGQDFADPVFWDNPLPPLAEVSQEPDVAVSVPRLLAYQCTKHQQTSDVTAIASPWCVWLVICVRSLGQH